MKLYYSGKIFIFIFLVLSSFLTSKGKLYLIELLLNIQNFLHIYNGIISFLGCTFIYFIKLFIYYLVTL